MPSARHGCSKFVVQGSLPVQDETIDSPAWRCYALICCPQWRAYSIRLSVNQSVSGLQAYRQPPNWNGGRWLQKVRNEIKLKISLRTFAAGTGMFYGFVWFFISNAVGLECCSCFPRTTKGHFPLHKNTILWVTRHRCKLVLTKLLPKGFLNPNYRLPVCVKLLLTKSLVRKV